MHRRSFLATAAAGLALPSVVRAQSASTLRFIAEIDLTFLDPHFTPANVTRSHGFMVFDTLFGEDGKGGGGRGGGDGIRDGGGDMGGGDGDGKGGGEGEKLSASVARHLKRYFDLHGGQLPPPGVYQRILREVELPLIEIALDATAGNQAKCADLLGINRNTLRKKITDLDIRVTRRRKLM